MARKPVIDMSAWPSFTLEGNLIAPAMVASIDRRQASEQSEDDYRIRKGLTIREEISTAFRVGQSHFDTFARLVNPSIDATRRFMRDFLRETFGYDDLAPSSGVVAFLAGGRVPIVVVPPSDEKLDRRSPALSVDRSRSPSFALQDYLNESDDALWGLVTNGAVIRLMRDNASLTRPAYIEADLVQIFTNEDAASFAVLWLLIHRSRFGVTGTPSTDCALERWRETGSREGEVARNRLAAQVKTALTVLGSGFLEANPDLANRIKSGDLKLTEWFNELLRLVYRLIFLMVAEDRNLLHPEGVRPEPRKLYVEGYSLAALRTQCVRSASWDKHHDRYEGIKVVFRALTHAQEALGLPALGGLFSSDKLPDLETARLRNSAFMEALYRLSWLSDKSGKVPVNWRAMETEELGSVYESLLELQPQLGDDGKTLVFASETAEQKGNQRKTTGSYYTPDSLVQALLDTALDPVLEKTEAESVDPVASLLKLTVIDPACGSGHFLLAAARRIATRVARIRAEGTPSLADFRHAMRDVARSCIHGVDRNPMAVELTKVALWIETVDPGLPLGFFDAQIRCGDALLGVFDLKVLDGGIPDTAYKPLTGDDKEVAKYYAQKNRREQAEKGRVAEGFGFNRASDLLRDFEALRAMPEDTVQQIEAKATRLRALTAQGASAWQLETACDLYVAAFLLPKRKGGPQAGPDGLPRRGAETIPTSGTLWEWLRGVPPFGPLFGSSIDTVRASRAFHWPLEFPDVIQHGGFDVVLGNPPWERIKLEEREFFALKVPEIAIAKGKATREAMIEALSAAPAGSPERMLHDEFIASKREAEASSEFVRVPEAEGGRFPFTGTGDVNTYALFAELFSVLYGKNGRSGVMVPTGIATNDTTAPFFDHLVISSKLVSLFSYSEIKAWFSGTKDNQSFSLVTLGRSQVAEFCFRIDSSQDTLDERRRFEFTSAEIVNINPNTRTAPVFRSRADAELTARIYSRAAVLINEREGPDGNPWGISFLSMFHMSNDSNLFHTGEKLRDSGFNPDGLDWVRGSARFSPLYEAKMVTYFDNRWGYYPDGADDDTRALPRPNEEQKIDPSYDISPRFWVDSSEIEARLNAKDWQKEWMIGHRGLTNNTNERTFITSLIPRRGAGNSLPVWIFSDSIAANKCAGLYANSTVLVLDFVVRNKIGGTNLNLFYLKQFPFFSPSFYTEPRLAFITPRVLELTYTSHSLTSFARDLGHDGPPFAWDEDRRVVLRADLDAFYARAYGLTREELRYILDPVDVKGPDYPSETFRVLKEKEIRQHGEYRTRRLVLEAWDRMEADGTFTSLGFNTGQAMDTAARVVHRPVLAELPDGAWARAAQSPNDAGAALTALLKSIEGPTPSKTIRFAAAMMLEPHLLTSLLPASRAQEWRRLVGQEAEPRIGNVVGFAARTNQGWGVAVSNHRGNGRLVEEAAAGTWAPGSGLDAFDTAGWADGRAGFILESLSSLDLKTITTSMPDDIRGWIADAATA